MVEKQTMELLELIIGDYINIQLHFHLYQFCTK